MKSHYEFEALGETRDDSAGEAFDKVAQLLNLSYPGGPSIAKAAMSGDDSAYPLPIIDLTPPPARNDNGYLEKAIPSLDFSFSGLKTAVLNTVKKKKNLSEKDINDIAASFQRAIVETIVQNSARAIDQCKPKTFILAGGVAANKELRNALENLSKKKNINFSMPAQNIVQTMPQ
jgi:N6-L-threonylcarbamoyladenine synthase